ncbi:hypothetical protein B0T26DRAFT_746036 [Lasiosphaeria miniovina]|uniref:DUF3237 domain-containing protein n=1 Tax=Lasiosphaeria miniovina TaxID=1954250 RepID=A0AA40BH25_9PEZI|nr:uncharacterized protein B0T26DRAFT_746036 [Lasiosphaeria miniovina]KAK0734081.1 hypothetical protein B0T26DRAFT_746036 [Lasiosphaeria miniovina]
MAGFPKLIPAFTAQIAIKAPNYVGPTAAGATLTHVEIIPGAGSIRAEAGYGIALDAVFAHGADFIKMDPDGRHVRLEVQSVAKDGPTGAFVRFNYTGTIFLGGPGGKVLTGEPDAKTTDFGEAFTRVVFESGHPELAALQTKVYVSSGRFIVEPGKPVIVEYKISEVVA